MISGLAAYRFELATGFGELLRLEEGDRQGKLWAQNERGIDRKRGAKFLHGDLISVLFQSVESLTEVGLRGAEPCWLVGRRRGLNQDVLREEQDKNDQAISKIAACRRFAGFMDFREFSGKMKEIIAMRC